MRNRSGLRLSKQLLYLLPATILFFDTPAGLAATDVDRAVWTGNAAYRTAKDKRWEIVGYLGNTLERQSNKFSAAQWTHQSDGLKYRDFVNQIYHHSDDKILDNNVTSYLDPSETRITRIYNSLKEAGSPAQFIQAFLTSWIEAKFKSKELVELEQQSPDIQSANGDNLQNILETIDNVYLVAQQDQDYSKFIDKLRC
jgi:hypothetical protein